ncbi:MAG: PorT family protein [Bacteroidales bacterium]|nr:PorT family protein [Bacteroidales bacterium]
MKHILILSVILISVTLKTEAQKDFSGGLLFGISASQVDGDAQYHYKKPGLILGAFVSRPLSKHGSLKIETYYIGKGAVLNKDYPDGTTVQIFNTSLHYVEMPFLFNLRVSPKIEIAAGIAPSYLFYAKQTSYKALVPDFQSTLNTFDFQPLVEAVFYLTDKILSSIRFSYSLFNQKKELMSTFYNNNLSLVFQYKIK